jgi:uncharacterized protein
MPELQLSLTDARVIAALAEKSITTPQYYPMTVNAVMAAANQKSARQPVMSLSEGEAGAALNRLEELKLAHRDDLAGRVPKWRHQFQHQLLLKPEPFAVLLALMLRGAQTVAEIRANAAPLKGPADADGVLQALELLTDRAQPLVRELPRAPGQSAARWAHLLCGEPDASAVAAPPPRRGGDDERVAALEARVNTLEEQLAELRRSLGME